MEISKDLTRKVQGSKCEARQPSVYNKRAKAKVAVTSHGKRSTRQFQNTGKLQVIRDRGKSTFCLEIQGTRHKIIRRARTSLFGKLLLQKLWPTRNLQEKTEAQEVV